MKQAFTVSRHVEQLRLRSEQHIMTNTEDCVLRTEMVNLESQEETMSSARAYVGCNKFD